MKTTLCLFTVLATGLILPVSGHAQHLLLATIYEPQPRLAMQPDPPPQANTSPMKDDLFAGTEKFAKGASSVDEVNMDPESLNMVGGPDAHRAHGMVLSVVRTYTYDKPGMYNPADVEVYRQKLETGDWHCSVHTRDRNGESTDICNRRRDPDLIENAIITASPKSLTFIHSIRKARPQGSSVGIDGALAGLPSGASIAVLNAQTKAEMLAATANLRVHMPEFTAQMHQLQLQIPALQEQLRNLHLQPFSPQQQQELENLRQQLHNLQ